MNRNKRVYNRQSKGEVLGDQKKENQMSFKGFLRQRSLGLNTTSWDDNEWALRGEERSDWASFGPVANVFFGGGGGALCRSASKVAQVSEEEGCGEAQCHSAQLRNRTT